ncbi:RdgB/HAM1 family non-canonical purine NTP pyrophosphatase [Fodinibius sp.]|uniref:RdgB/HAM1 family non-canonical purine NTP pyrophosphatase n=1 Tax=Fodinibius sp. TaxID=1872440 RepID=UPI002ACDAA37|nr:RdgB/HAM1 family non-canonical purine NTP pyrophosphatase [Fodinibius sp.]MDZ7659604.1 RdgB/HAM1 family non-canonical purine NTP pyrophosphatase [Fodinibius sp.]
MKEIVKEMDTIVLASRNKHKIKELRETLSPLGIELKSTYDFPDLEEVIEDADTLEGNALKKARYVYNQTGLPALSDDTGLEVDALNGRPGVFSARYAGENATDQDNVDKLLEELSGIPMERRGAQFRTVAAFVTDDDSYTFEGICRGMIISEERGSGGFGYDPVFLPVAYKKTFAELDPGIKNKISHRGKAIQKFYEWLENEKQ